MARASSATAQVVTAEIRACALPVCLSVWLCVCLSVCLSVGVPH